jgi:ribonucleoside-diphosphate reductase alpha chain
VMDAFSMSISVGLQYGIPLEFYVSKFSNLRFEPAGMTDDPDVRIATSVMDYLFRRLALDHLPYEKRAQLGIFSADERSAQVAETYGSAEVDLEELRSGVEHGSTPPPVGASPRRSRSAAPPSCSSCTWARPPTRRCA